MNENPPDPAPQELTDPTTPYSPTRVKDTPRPTPFDDPREGDLTKPGEEPDPVEETERNREEPVGEHAGDISDASDAPETDRQMPQPQ